MKYLRGFVRPFDKEIIQEIKDILQDLFDEFGINPSDESLPGKNEYHFRSIPKKDQNWGCYINMVGSDRGDEIHGYIESHIVPRIKFLGIEPIVKAINVKKFISAAIDDVFLKNDPLIKKNRFTILPTKKIFYIYLLHPHEQD